MNKGITETSQFVKIGQELSLGPKECIELIRSTFLKKASLRFQVQGFSMTPFIKDGDIVTLAPLPEYRIGFGWPLAISKLADKDLLIHRLIKIHNKSPQASYITKGDNVHQSDYPIFRSDILGYVKKVQRGGRIISFGMGPERRLIAYLSRLNILQPLLFFWRCIPYLLNRRYGDRANYRSN